MLDEGAKFAPVTPYRRPKVLAEQDLAKLAGGVPRRPPRPLRALVHDEAFNVGSSAENYGIRELAEIVEDVVPGARVCFAAGGGSDKRSYQVDCSKITRVLPDFETRWTVPRAWPDHLSEDAQASRPACSSRSAARRTTGYRRPELRATSSRVGLPSLWLSTHRSARSSSGVATAPPAER
jgi:hypothetical protein